MTYKNAFVYTLILYIASVITSSIIPIIGDILLFIISVINQIIKDIFPFFEMNSFSALFKNFSLLDLTYHIGMFFLFYIYIKKKKIPFSFSFNKMSSLRNYPLYFIAIGSMILFYSFISFYIFNVIPDVVKSNKELDFFISLNKELARRMTILDRNKISFFISSVFLVPILEELVFRGFILKELLRKKSHAIKPILFSSFLFGFIHFNPIQPLGSVFMGIILGIILSTIYYQNKSILDCIILHSFHNIIGFFLMINPNKGQIIGGQIKHLPLLASFILLIISIFSTYVIYQKGLKKEKSILKSNLNSI